MKAKVEEPEVMDMKQVVLVVVNLARLKPFAMGELSEYEKIAVNRLAYVYGIGRGSEHES